MEVEKADGKAGHKHARPKVSRSLISLTLAQPLKTVKLRAT